MRSHNVAKLQVPEGFNFLQKEYKEKGANPVEKVTKRDAFWTLLILSIANSFGLKLNFAAGLYFYIKPAK